MKKEYLSKLAKDLNERSDTELIDIIAETPSSEYVNRIEATKAILDKRLKIVLQYLTELIKKNNESTEKYNKTLSKLTTWILIFTVVMTLTTIVSVILVIKNN
ncbi:MAG: hypothetical protein WC505_04405 [Patescibacteria group bacterium]